MQEAGIEAAVGVRGERPRDAVDARQSDQWAAVQCRKFPEETGRQQRADVADLLFNDVEVVEQPFGGRRNRALLVDGSSNGLVGADEYPRVVGAAPGEAEPRQAEIPGCLCFRKALGVLLESLRAEYFGPQRLVARAPALRPRQSKKPVRQVSVEVQRLPWEDYSSACEYIGPSPSGIGG